MKLKHRSLNLAEFAGIVTWGIVFAICLYALPKMPSAVQADRVAVILLFLGYIGCFLAIIRKGFLEQYKHVEYALLLVQLLTAFGIMWLLPLEFLPILTIIWVAMLPHFMSLRRAVLIMVLVLTLWFTLYALRWDNPRVIFSALLYGTFHFFAIIMTHQAHLAETANLEAQRLNQELEATQNLLAEASRQNERTRIARDLHDLLGHHLTALIINLQVAGHLTEGEAKTKVEQCHAIAKLLLSDVREAVSTLRENQSLDFCKMVNLLVDNLPNLTVHQHMDADLDLDDLELAKALLSIIQEAMTNSLRHSGGDEFWLSLIAGHGELLLTMYDNGHAAQTISQGNGLNGMRERVEAMAGTLDLGRENSALKLMIRIPH